MSKIQRVLQAYTLVRPTVRLSLKVLKAKNNKQDWIYNPAKGISTKDAVMGVFGKRVVDQCQWIVWTSPSIREMAMIGTQHSSDDERNANDPFTVIALMPSNKSGE